MPARPLPVTCLPALGRDAIGADVVKAFEAYPDAPGFAIVDDRQFPIGYIDKQSFVTKFMSLYGRALYDKRPAETLSSQDYRTVSLNADLESVGAIERGEDDISMNTGLVVIQEDGAYYGMTSAFALMSVVLRENERLVETLRQEVKEREAAERRVRQIAQTDELTGLPNRRLFMQYVRQKVEASTAFMVTYIDLDRFKRINDLHGHAAGDLVLKTIAERLHRFAGSEFCARLGGDEFALITPVIETPELLLRRAKSLKALLSKPMETEFGELSVGASFGTALYPEEFTDLEALIDAADKRMLRAKVGPGRRASDLRRISQLRA